MILAAPNNGGLAVQRIAGGLRGAYPVRFLFPCRDGHVTITLMFGHAFEGPNRQFLAWLHEHGAVSAEDVAGDWDAEMAAIAEWTEGRNARDLESLLVEAGVATHVVQNTAECLADPQLRHRGHFQSVPHPGVGEFVVEASRFQLSRTPAQVARAGPELREHNFHVLHEILGYDAERVAHVLASGAMDSALSTH